MEKVENLTEALKSDILKFLYKDEMMNLNLIDALESNKIGDLYIMKINDKLSAVLHSRFDGNSRFTNFFYSSKEGLQGIINQLKSMNKDKMLLAGVKRDVLEITKALDGRSSCNSDLYYKLNRKESFNINNTEVLFRKTRLCNEDSSILKHFLVEFFQAIIEEEIKAITDEKLIEADLKDGTYFIEKDGKVIGMARICGETHNYSEVTGVYISPEYRGHGYGKILMMYMVNHILKANKIPVLQAAAENIMAIRTYEALDFIKVEDYSFEFL